MSKIFASTPKGTPIAAWMVKANPSIFDVGTALAVSGVDGDWTWSAFPTYRAGLVDVGQPVFLWVTQNENPALVSGIWVVGKATGPCYVTSSNGNVLWRDLKKAREKKPYLPFVGSTLLAPVTREQLLDHPVLCELELFTSPAMSNPLIITGLQLDALRRDFDLSTGPLADDLRDQLRSEYEFAEIWIAGGDHGDVQVWPVEGGGWTVERRGAVLAEESDQRTAILNAVSLAADPKTIADDDDVAIVAEMPLDDGTLSFVWSDGSYFLVVEVDDAEDPVEVDEVFSTLESAVVHALDIFEEP